MVAFQCSQTRFQVVLQGIQTVEDSVVKRLFAKFIPEVFNRVEFRRIGR